MAKICITMSEQIRWGMRFQHLLDVYKIIKITTWMQKKYFSNDVAEKKMLQVQHILRIFTNIYFQFVMFYSVYCWLIESS